ncbi:hypothetical protein ANCCAN_29864 [Ancylostoma caninum]|uniref:Uncharacterized protein n=1 Tax=Ancylostoma caninum TaxID=29170 RepID=A0A368F061_ANCCA|nr:hypothetical protein ANCCAN_29864 [Ancylostoma caninum]
MLVVMVLTGGFSRVRWSIFIAIMVSSLSTLLVPPLYDWNIHTTVVLKVIQGASVAPTVPLVGHVTAYWTPKAEIGVFVSLLTSYSQVLSMHYLQVILQNDYGDSGHFNCTPFCDKAMTSDFFALQGGRVRAKNGVFMSRRLCEKLVQSHVKETIQESLCLFVKSIKLKIKSITEMNLEKPPQYSRQIGTRFRRRCIRCIRYIY